MGFLDGLKKFFGFEEEVQEIHEEEEGIVIGEDTGVKVVVIEPKSFDEAQEIIDDLKDGRPVIINFEDTDRELARRIIDFISGGAYALDGSTEKISNYVFLFVPKGVEITKESKKFWKKHLDKEEKEE
ncbi:MAG: cell division protein SepF [Caldisericia bacterium]|jgi:cell division inhibitor SepF|nr:cell division protein SepF [Caldisericia bacterium]